jgi:hypothetical protein
MVSIMDLISTDKQVLFNTAVRKLVKQGQKSGDATTCYYQKCDGVRCALGWLMTEEAIKKYGSTEGDLSTLAGYHRFNIGKKYNYHFLCDLQFAHDIPTTRTEFRDLMLNVAKKYKLNDNRARRLLSITWTKENNCVW